MLENWLQPFDYPTAKLPAHSWGKNIHLYQGRPEELVAGQVVMIGLNPETADALRAALYPLSWAFPGLELTDLGNVRKTDPEFVIPLIRELLDSQLTPILIGSRAHELAYAQFQSFLTLRDLVSLVVVDEQLPFTLKPNRRKEDYLNKIIHSRRESLFHLGFVGPQAHFSNPDSLHWLEDQNFECIRLGKARSELPEVEPLIRDADIVSFHLRALKQCEAPGQLQPSPSGFFLEEACQLCRYAGMSDKLRSFSITGVDAEKKRKLPATAQALAQMVWYFTEGYYQRKNDYPATNKGLTEYVVDLKGKDGRLVFWKSNKSGRWWLQVPVKTGRKYQRHRLIPCSYKDYSLATQDEVPDRLLNAFKRFS